MKSIKIKNLRSLSDTGFLDIKPLTLLLGVNSSGKSTFLRSFPLLRQSSEQKTANDILWFGDYVDFGDFETSLNRDLLDNKEKEISFSFRFIIDKSTILNFSDNGFNGFSEEHNLIEFVLTQRKFDNKNISIYEIKSENNNLLLEIYDDESIKLIKINDIDVTVSQKEVRIIKKSELLPYIYLEAKDIEILPITYLFNYINFYLTTLFSNIHYIKPLRATAERFYRIQGLAVNEISPDGENIPMFLKSLSDDEAKDFAEWTMTNLGFSIYVKSDAGHVSIVIDDNKKREIHTNLADVGFGYSQIIPILAQIWQAKKHTNKKENKTKFLLIEQPELHLHPKMQSKIAELFFKTSLLAKESGLDLRIIIETHSETIVAKLGDLISRKTEDNKSFVPKDWINLFVFEPDKEKQKTHIRQSYFDNDGLLENWPYDFFDGDF